MKFGKIYNYKNAEEAKKLIGKKVIASDYLCCLEDPKESTHTGIFRGINREKEVPFSVELPRGWQSAYQFIREVIEKEKPLMTNRQLAEWLAKGNGEWTCFDGTYVNNISIMYADEEKNIQVGKNILIRPWDSDEWVVPTLEIYERDCKSYCRTTLA